VDAFCNLPVSGPMHSRGRQSPKSARSAHISLSVELIYC
jgi:hypothetical protein